MEPAAAADLLVERSKDVSVPAESSAKDLLHTIESEGTGAAVESNGAAEAPSAANSSLPGRVPEEEEEATPTPPESSSSLSPEHETLTVATTEEESLLKTEGGPDRGGKLGKRPEQIQDQLD